MKWQWFVVWLQEKGVILDCPRDRGEHGKVLEVKDWVKAWAKDVSFGDGGWGYDPGNARKRSPEAAEEKKANTP